MSLPGIRSTKARHNALVHRTASRRLGRLFVLVCAVAVTALGCAQKNLPPYGEVLLLLSTDMPVPESFDTLIVTMNGTGRAYVSDNAASLDNPEPECKTGEGTSVTLSRSKLRLPTSVALFSDRDEAVTRDVQIIACKSGKLVFRRELRGVEIPAPGELKVLRAPIRWLCANRRCQGCEESENPLARGRCYHEPISMLASPAADTCAPISCQDEAGTFEVVPYVADEAARFDPTLTADASGCFQPWSCLGMSEGSDFDTRGWTQLPTAWEQLDSDAGSDRACVATLDATLRLDADRLNLALVLPPGDLGFCDRRQNRCFVPLDFNVGTGENRSTGWNWSDRNRSRVTLPNALCHLLDSGQVLYVIGATNPDCATKTRATPICGKVEKPLPSAPTPPLVDFASTYLQLDDIDGNVADTRGNTGTLEWVRETNAAAPSATADAAVRGSAGRVNSHRYAQGPSSDSIRLSGTVSAFVSLTEAPGPNADVMPVLSTIGDDCRSGFRLELRSCSERTRVVVALGMPRGTGQNGCRLDYTYALMTQKSFRGGFYNPWQTGDFHHIAATIGGANDVRLYVDGKLGDAVPTDCALEPSSVQPSDGSSLYLGSQAAMARAPEVTHDILVDEVALFSQPLPAEEIQRLSVELSTVLGASGLRWGVWSSQGSRARLVEATPRHSFVVEDRAYASAGSQALLDGSTSNQPPRLSEYDEAVLVVAGLPRNKPFQFAFVADHGRRQCTWHLRTPAASSETDAPEMDTYVINLRRPSWCVDPQCSFDTDKVERVSIGSDWSTDQGAFEYSIRALAFRKRTSTSAPGTAPPSRYLGGVTGPSGWCWKPVSFDAAWEREPVTLAAPRDETNPVGLAKATQHGDAIDPPEIAADLPDDLGARDFTSCRAVELCLSLGTIVEDPTPGKNRKLAMTNASGQTCDWRIPDLAGCIARVDVNECGGWSPDPSTTPTSLSLRRAVTRLSVRYTAEVEVRSVKCCTSATDPSSCVGIETLPLASSN